MKKITSFLLALLLMFAQLSVGGYAQDFVIPEDPTAEQHWATVAADAFACGSGSEEDPYYIETPEQLARLCNVESENKYFALACDINLSAREWRAIPSFAGHLLGNGYTISGMSVNRVGSALSEETDVIWDTGFISVLESQGVVCDLQFNVSKVSISNFKSGTVTVGTVAGKSKGEIRNVSVTDGKIDGNQALSESIIYMGGIAGVLCDGAVLENCVYNGGLSHTKIIGNTADSASYMGGAVGAVLSESVVLRNNRCVGYLLSSQCESGMRKLYAGGIVGYLYAGSINDCASEMHVLVHAPREVVSGGAVGYAVGGALDNCFASGAVQAGALNTVGKTVGVYAGGLVGRAEKSIITDCFTSNSMVQATMQSGGALAQGGKLVGGMTELDWRNCYVSATTIVMCSLYNAQSGTVMNMPMASNNEGINGFTYSASFVTDTLGWELYRDLADFRQNPDHVWVYSANAALPVIFTPSFLSVRYEDAEGKLLSVCFSYYDIGSVYAVESPAFDGMIPEVKTLTGILQKNTFAEVTYSAHIHTPGDAPSCDSAQCCTSCGAILAEKLSHTDENKDLRCDMCHKETVDLTADGVLDMKDAARLQRHVLKIELIADAEVLSMADVNADGAVDMKDAAKLTRYVIRIA